MASLSERLSPPAVAEPKARVAPRRVPHQYERLALHPFVIAASAALVVADLARFGIGARGVVGLLMLPVLVVLSAIDFRHRLLPNRIVLPATAAVAVAQVALASDHGRAALLAAFAAAAAFFILHVAYPSGLGMGDVKLALLLGASLGSDVMSALFLGSLAAAVAGGAVILRDGPAGRKATLAFGPFLALGAVVAFFVG